MTVDFIIKNWYLFAMAAVIVVLLLLEPVRQRASGVRKVTALEMPQLLRDDAVIVDVSEPKDFKKSHITNSINIPFQKLNADASALSKKKNKTIVITCRAGNRSASAARLLTKQGFANVYVLSGGIMAWEKENLPTTKG